LGKTVGDLLESMSYKELNGWSRYYEEQPFGSWRDNYHSAIIASMLWNVNSGKGKSKTPDDFMLKPAKERSKSETLTTLAQLQALAQRKE
tara:strand:- start:4989 stop:5258 length:270 start_codon:yes stop_codon:yes gene_type:complete